MFRKRQTAFSIAFHIGPHKTATSHLQRSFREAGDALAAAGVQYCGPEQFRGPQQTIAHMMGLRPKTAASQAGSPAAQIETLRQGAQRLVLSEENYIGTLNNPRKVAAKMRYPRARQKLEALTAVLPVDGIDIFVSMRQPTHFLNSAYCQMLLGGNIIDLDAYLARNPLDSVDWLSLLRRLQKTRGIKSITAWRYEDYRVLFPQITAAMTGPAGAGLVQPVDKDIHVGLSQVAVAHVLENRGEGPQPKLATRARRRFPVAEGAPRFDAFSPEQHAQSAARYAEQVAGIAALRNVRLLRP